MKVGDLVRVKYDGKVGIVTGVGRGSVGPHTNKATWIRLHNERMTFNVEKLELISASR